MDLKGKKVFIALSGGVDSAVAAAMLKNSGCRCAGVHMLTSAEQTEHQKDAERIAGELGIEFFLLDLEKEFSTVLDYFADEYKNARTPNPCVFCNRHIKFGVLLDFALKNGADFFATGHYIQIDHTAQGPEIFAAENIAKDQSYILSMVNRDALDYVLFPLGKSDKTQTRRKAAELGLSIENKPDSQEICFIPDDDYVGTIERLCPQISRQGQIITEDQQVLGTHNGIHKYTIGQRRGLGVAMGTPYYVVSLDAQSNTVVLGPKEKLLSKEFTASSANWLIDKPQSKFRATIKIRYNHRGSPGTVFPMGNDIRVVFDEPVSAVTPGQTAAIYIESPKGLQLAGGGWIDRNPNQ